MGTYTKSRPSLNNEDMRKNLPYSAVIRMNKRKHALKRNANQSNEKKSQSQAEKPELGSWGQKQVGLTDKTNLPSYNQKKERESNSNYQAKSEIKANIKKIEVIEEEPNPRLRVRRKDT